MARDPCPICSKQLIYRIARDAYVCQGCGLEYDTLSCETDHIAYNGGPPRLIENPDA